MVLPSVFRTTDGCNMLCLAPFCVCSSTSIPSSSISRLYSPCPPHPTTLHPHPQRPPTPNTELTHLNGRQLLSELEVLRLRSSWKKKDLHQRGQSKNNHQKLYYCNKASNRCIATSSFLLLVLRPQKPSWYCGRRS